MHILLENLCDWNIDSALEKNRGVRVSTRDESKYKRYSNTITCRRIVSGKSVTGAALFLVLGGFPKTISGIGNPSLEAANILWPRGSRGLTCATDEDPKLRLNLEEEKKKGLTGDRTWDSNSRRVRCRYATQSVRGGHQFQQNFHFSKAHQHRSCWGLYAHSLLAPGTDAEGSIPLAIH